MFYKSVFKKEDDFEKELEKLRLSQQEKLEKIEKINSLKKNEYSQNFTQSFKKKIFKRDNYQCQFPDCFIKEDLTVHHILYQKKMTDENSCITLCRAHNSFVNKKEEREIWKSYFKRLLHYKSNR